MSLLLWLPLKSKNQGNYGIYDSTITDNGTYTNRSLTGGSITATVPIDLFKTVKQVTVSYFFKSKTHINSLTNDGWLWQVGSQAENSCRGHYISGVYKGLNWAGWAHDKQLVNSTNISKFFDTNWHHMCMMIEYDGSWKLKTWIDGVDLSLDNVPDSAASTFVSGALTLSTNFGYFRDFKVYDEVLCPSQIILNELNAPDCVGDLSNNKDVSENNIQITYSSSSAPSSGSSYPGSLTPCDNKGFYYGQNNREIWNFSDMALEEFSVIADIYVSALPTSANDYKTILRNRKDILVGWFCVNTESSGIWFFTNGRYYKSTGGLLPIGYHCVGMKFVKGVCTFYCDGQEVGISETGTTARYGNIPFGNIEICDGQLSHNNTGGLGISRVRFYCYGVSNLVLQEKTKLKNTLAVGRLKTQSNTIFAQNFNAYNQSKISINRTIINSVDLSSVIYDKETGWWLYPLSCQVINANSDPTKGGPYLSNDVDKRTNMQYVNDKCWCRLHMINPSVSGNIISQCVGGGGSYEFVIYQGRLDTGLTRIRWKQTKNPYQATWADVSPSSTSITKYENDSQGGIYYAHQGDRGLIHANTNSGNNYGLLHRSSWSTNNTLPCCNNQTLSGDVVQILCVRLGSSANGSVSKGGFSKTGMIDMPNYIEIQ